MNLRAVLKQGERLLKKHSPEILTGLGLVTLASSVVLAVKATPKALWVIEHEEIQQAHPLSTKEKLCSRIGLYHWRIEYPSAPECSTRGSSKSHGCNV